jgi:hypothetical protein
MVGNVMTAQNINMNMSQHHTEVFQPFAAPKGMPYSTCFIPVSHLKFSVIDLHRLFKAMPAPAINFVGRDEQLKELQLYFQPRNSETSNCQRRSCAVHGTGGIGKTQFTLKFIESNQQVYVRTFFRYPRFH